MSFVRTLPLTLLLAASAVAQEKHLLRFKFVPDTVVHYSMSQEMDMSINMGAQDMSTKMNMQMFMTTKVKGVKDDAADLEQEITRVKAVMNNPMMNVNFDSDDEDSDPGMLEGMADMVGTKTTMRLSSAGKMLDFAMSEELAEEAEQAGMDLKQMMSQSVTSLPEQPVAIGETWTNTMKMPMGQMGELDMQIENKLVAVDDKHIVVDQVIKVDTTEVEMPGGMALESVEAKGTSKIDRRIGMPAELTMNMRMKMSGQMTMTMDMKQTIRPAAAPAKKADDGK